MRQQFTMTLSASYLQKLAIIYEQEKKQDVKS